MPHLRGLTYLSLLLFAVCAALFALPSQGVADTRETIAIGVLAKRGPERTHTRWDATADYLTEKLPGYRFTIVPLDFDEIHDAVERQRIDFVLANSAYYVDLEVRYGVSRLATLSNRHGELGLNRFAGVIFCRADRDDIRTLRDLRGKSFMAVDEQSFGGFHMAWRELAEQGIDPYRHFTPLEIGGTHDAVVHAVAEGKVDAGTVRSDTLERMAEEGRIDLALFRILNPHTSPGFPFLHSTRLYPEWPIAKLAKTPNPLAQQVAVALLQMPPDGAVARAANSRGWTIPHEYQPVHECLKTLRITPYQDFGRITPQQAIRQFWPWFLFGALLLLLGVLTSLYLLRLNRRLDDSRRALAEAHRGLEEKVALRTRELQVTNTRLLNEVEERKRSEEALFEERHKLELITRNLGVGVAIISRDYRTVMANEVIRNLFGDVEGRRCYCAYNQRDEICPDCGVQRIFEEGASQAVHEQRGYDADGNEIWSQIIATPLRDETGEVQAAIEVIVPITERKRAEQSLRRALEEAEETRDKVDNIVKSVADGLIVTDTEHVVITLNAAAGKILATTAEQALGRPASELFAPHGLREAFANFQAKESLGTGLWEFELDETPARARHAYQARASVMRNAKGVATGTILIIRDVTRERELNRLKDNFISTAAHELLTPLTTIIGYAEMVLDADRNAAMTAQQRAGFLKEIIDKGMSLSRIVDELLDLSRIESGQPVPLQREPTSLQELVGRILDQHRQLATRHSFELILSGDTARPAEVDPHRINQVLENLLSNAIKYSPDGGEIRVRLAERGENVQVSVEDEGIGMSAEEVEKVFDKFYRADHAATAIRGLGLGMSIVKQIVENHGGRIWVDSTPGKGTQVHFTIPV